MNDSLRLSHPEVTRSSVWLHPDRSRVLLRPFLPATEQQCIKLISRVLALGDDEIEQHRTLVLSEFSERHQKTKDFFLARFKFVQPFLVNDTVLSVSRQLVIGSYFTHEYALEAASLFNPSVVPHWDQTELAPSELRVILSLRATGEGHISSITFRTAVLNVSGEVMVNEPTRYVTEPEFEAQAEDIAAHVREHLEDSLLPSALREQIVALLTDATRTVTLALALRDLARTIPFSEPELRALFQTFSEFALANYDITFPSDMRLSERIIFPRSARERNGMEDARFVPFSDEHGHRMYLATYTAYDGRAIYPQLLTTVDFCRFSVRALRGSGAQNKGMALFPRKVNGQFVMLSRQDGENIGIMFSPNLLVWRQATVLLKPTHPWEFVQLGNCGSPLETEKGWLVLSHGVGAMRKYSIGAFLLDLVDPTKVIARLRDPLLTPGEDERDGYVPNVVYSCGAIIHQGMVIIPYAVADSSTRFARIPLLSLLNAMEPNPTPPQS